MGSTLRRAADNERRGNSAARAPNVTIMNSAEGLADEDVERFVRDGVLHLAGAFGRELADECRRLLWAATGCAADDPGTWTRPVIRIDGRSDAPFRAAANTPQLHAAFDRLAGRGRWAPLAGLGTFPIRFPSSESPGDDGWHVEATGVDESGALVIDPASRERVLLLLFLFSDVGPADAPTRIRIGSHLDAARALTRATRPVDFFTAAGELERATRHRPEAAATGAAGDVWLCHPYLVHAAQPHRGTQVKFMAQPPLPGTGPIDATRPDRSPVEEAVRRAVHADAS
jgi:hypothetical protein